MEDKGDTSEEDFCENRLRRSAGKLSWRDRTSLNDFDAGDFLVGFVAGNAHGGGVEDGFAVHQELIMVGAVVERDLEAPTAVGLAFHGEGIGLPVVEIPDECHAAGAGGGVGEIDQLGQFLEE